MPTGILDDGRTNGTQGVGEIGGSGLCLLY